MATDEDITESELSVYFGEKYGAFAISANARAIPDCRDGLKPVHRRILYAASRIAPSSKPTVKAVRIVGEVLAG